MSSKRQSVHQNNMLCLENIQIWFKVSFVLATYLNRHLSSSCNFFKYETLKSCFTITQNTYQLKVELFKKNYTKY